MNGVPTSRSDAFWQLYDRWGEGLMFDPGFLTELDHHQEACSKAGNLVHAQILVGKNN